MVDSIGGIGGNNSATSIVNQVADAFDLGFEELIAVQLEGLRQQDPTKPFEVGDLIGSFAQFSSILSQQSNTEQITAQSSSLDEIATLIAANGNSNDALAQLIELAGTQQDSIDTLNQQIAALTQGQQGLQNSNFLTSLSLEQQLALSFVDRELLVEESTVALEDGPAEFAYFLPEGTNAVNIDIFNSDGEVVDSIDVADTDGAFDVRIHDFVWDGIGTDGTAYTEGEFSIQVTASTQESADVAASIRGISAEELNTLEDSQIAFNYNLDSAAIGASARIYDADGSLVRTIDDLPVGEGAHGFTWDGLNDETTQVDQAGAYKIEVSAIYPTGEDLPLDVAIYRNVGNSSALVDGGLTINYALEDAVDASDIIIRDGFGNIVRTIEAEGLAEGDQSIYWDGNDQDGNAVSEDGTYSVEVRTFAGEITQADADTFAYKVVSGVQSAGLGNTFLTLTDGSQVPLEDAFALRRGVA